MNTADEIWNRAATSGGGDEPRAGDVALSSVLTLHNLAMSGGLLDAVQRLDSGALDAAESGYRWLHLGAAADLVATVREEITDGALDDDHRAENLELRADEQYAELIPTDDALVDAFTGRLSEQPEAFATT